MARVGSCFREGVTTGLNSDFTMAPAQPLMSMWVAVNRINEKGKIMGKEECITPQQGLEAITINAARVLGLDPTNVESMSLAYEKLYAQIPQLLDFFPKYVPGFEKAFLLEIAPAMGVRESRRITGDYTLSTDDVINGNEHNDVIALGGYHVDIHRPSGTWVDSMNVQTYDIPYRSLVVKNKEGMVATVSNL